MSNPPKIPDPVPESNEVIKDIEDILPYSISKEEMNDIISFFHSNSKPLFSGQDTYFILGSYKKYPMRRLRVVENRVNRKILSYAFILADLLEPENIKKSAESVPWTHCKFHLLALYSSYLLMVMEGRHAGPSIELGEITSSEEYFSKTYVLPRTYDGIGEDDIHTDVDLENPYSQVQKDKFNIFDNCGKLSTWDTKEALADRTDEIVHEA